MVPEMVEPGEVAAGLVVAEPAAEDAERRQLPDEDEPAVAPELRLADRHAVAWPPRRIPAGHQLAARITARSSVRSMLTHQS